MKSPTAASLARSGARDALHLERDQVAHQPQQRGRAAARRAAGSAARPTARVGHAQLESPRPPRRPAPRARPRATRRPPPARCSQRRARSRWRRARAAGGARHLGQAGAGLDRLGDLVERSRKERGSASAELGWTRWIGRRTRIDRRSRRRAARSPRRSRAVCPRMNRVRKPAASFSHSAPVAAPGRDEDQRRRSRRARARRRRRGRLSLGQSTGHRSPAPRRAGHCGGCARRPGAIAREQPEDRRARAPSRPPRRTTVRAQVDARQPDRRREHRAATTSSAARHEPQPAGEHHGARPPRRSAYAACPLGNAEPAVPPAGRRPRPVDAPPSRCARAM